MIIITLFMTAMVVMVTLLSCVSDIRSLRIPNWHSALAVVCFIPAWLCAPAAFNGIMSHIGALVIMLGVTYLMFIKGMMGGGDSKLGSALGLWVGLKGLLPFMLYMAIMGGIVGAASLFLRKKKPFKRPLAGGWVEQVQNGHNAVPYGIAISFGFWMALFHTGFIHNQINELIKIIH